VTIQARDAVIYPDYDGVHKITYRELELPNGDIITGNSGGNTSGRKPYVVKTPNGDVNFLFFRLYERQPDGTYIYNDKRYKRVQRPDGTFVMSTFERGTMDLSGTAVPQPQTLEEYMAIETKQYKEMHPEGTSQLVKDLMNGMKIPQEPLPPTILNTEMVDISSWIELSFLDAPTISSTLCEIDIGVIDPARRFIDLANPQSAGYLSKTRLVLPSTYLSVRSLDKEKAVAELRSQLSRLTGNPDCPTVVLAWSFKPVLVRLVRDVRPGEVSDCETCTDLSGPRPGKMDWCVFCSLHVMYGSTFPFKEQLNKLGITVGVQEGEVGPEV
jgi:hypothetical protein